MSKEVTKYWEAKAIEFGEYVYNNSINQAPDLVDIDELWEQFQEQMVKDVNEDKWKKNEEVLIQIAELIKLLHERIDSNYSLMKLTDTIVSANGIALNNIEKDLYIDEKFVFNKPKQ